MATLTSTGKHEHTIEYLCSSSILSFDFVLHNSNSFRTQTNLMKCASSSYKEDINEIKFQTVSSVHINCLSLEILNIFWCCKNTKLTNITFLIHFSQLNNCGPGCVAAVLNIQVYKLDTHVIIMYNFCQWPWSCPYNHESKSRCTWGFYAIYV